MEIEREVLAQMTRLFGAENESAETSASNLGLSLSQCGKMMEAEQLVRETLGLSSARTRSDSRVYAGSVSARTRLRGAVSDICMFVGRVTHTDSAGHFKFKL